MLRVVVGRLRPAQGGQQAVVDLAEAGVSDESDAVLAAPVRDVVQTVTCLAASTDQQGGLATL